MTAELSIDELWPRDALHRFRLYAVTDAGQEVLAAAPDIAGIGVAILALHEDEKAARRGGRLADRGRIGILDVCPDPPAPAGEWIVLPYDRRST